MSGMSWAFAVSYSLLWIVVLLQSYVLIEALRQLGLIRMRIGPEPGALLVDDGLKRGDLVPELTSVDLRSNIVVPISTRNDQRTLFVFVTPRCQSCIDLLGQLPKFSRAYARDVQVAVVCSGPKDECQRLILDQKGEFEGAVLADPDGRITAAFRVQRTPSATLVDGEGRVRIHGVPNDWRQLAGLLEEEGSIPGGIDNWDEVTANGSASGSSKSARLA